MVKSFLVSMFTILLFSLGATVSWFYLQMAEKTDEEAEPTAGFFAEDETTAPKSDRQSNCARAAKPR